MISVSLNGFGSGCRCQEGKDSGQNRRRTWMSDENEFDDILIMPEHIWCTKDRSNLQERTMQGNLGIAWIPVFTGMTDREFFL